MSAVVLLGAEGCTERPEWVREPTEEELVVLQSYFKDEKHYVAAQIDGIGRPYWPKTVLETAPAQAIERAKRHVRLVRLED